MTNRQQIAQHSTWVSIGVNTVLVVLQCVVGVLAHSQALIADGVHSLSDLVADGVVLFANRRSDARPDEDHNYGHSRYENVASLFLGALLVVVGVGMLWRAGARMSDLADAPPVHLAALLVAAVAVVAKEGLFRFMLRQAERARSSLLVANAWHARSDAASSLVVSLGVLGSLLGFPFLDPLAAAIVGFLVGRMGWSFAWGAMQDLSDRAVDDDTVAQVRQVLAETPGVRAVHALRTRKMGDSAVVDAHLLVDPRISVSEGHFIAETARARLLSLNRSASKSVAGKKNDAEREQAPHRAEDGATPTGALPAATTTKPALPEAFPILDALIHIDPEDDDSMPVTVPPLPSRETLLPRARAALAPYGLSLVRLELHYLGQGVDAELYLNASDVTAETALCGADGPDWRFVDWVKVAHDIGVRRARPYLVARDSAPGA